MTAAMAAALLPHTAVAEAVLAAPPPLMPDPQAPEVKRNRIRLYNPEQATLAGYIRASAARGLPMIRPGALAGRKALLVGTGPSLDARGGRALVARKAKGRVVVGVKMATRILADRGIAVDYAVACHPEAREVEKTPIVPGVTYIVASCCHPALFDHLLGAGCPVQVFHSYCGGFVEPGSGLSEGGLYRALFAGDDWVAIGGQTVLNRAIAALYRLGIAHVTLAGADFGVRPPADTVPGAAPARDPLAPYYARAATGAIMPNAVFVDDGGRIDGRPWRTQPPLIVSAVSVARLILGGYVGVIGDSLAKSLARKPDLLDRAVTGTV